MALFVLSCYHFGRVFVLKGWQVLQIITQKRCGLYRADLSLEIPVYWNSGFCSLFPRSWTKASC